MLLQEVVKYLGKVDDLDIRLDTARKLDSPSVVIDVSYYTIFFEEAIVERMVVLIVTACQQAFLQVDM